MTASIRRSLVCSLLVLCALLSPFFVHGQTTEGLQLKPAVVEDRVAPGELYRFSLRVTNISNDEKTFYLNSQDIKAADDQGHPIFAEEGQATGYELSSWISMPQSALTLKGGETREVQFVARVPETASPGAHFAAIFFDARPPSLQESGSGVGIKVGSIINLRIAGDIVEDATLREFSTENLVYGTADAVFRTRVENHGNVLVRPRGVIEVSDMRGVRVASVPINDAVAAVFPGSIKLFTSEWHGQGFAFGRYQAVVSLVYGDEVRRTISGATSFWVLPIKPILIALGVVLGAIVLLYFGVRAYIQRKLRAMGISNTQRVAADLYTQKYSRSSSRLFFLVLGISLFVLIFLIGLFVMFA